MQLTSENVEAILIIRVTQSDYDNIHEVLTPHCSQCCHYECLANATMYCNKLQKRITARKQPCKHYIEK